MFSTGLTARGARRYRSGTFSAVAVEKRRHCVGIRSAQPTELGFAQPFNGAHAPPSLTFGALLALQAWCVPVLSETTMKKLSHTSPNTWDRVIGLGSAFLLVAGVLFDVFVR